MRLILLRLRRAALVQRYYGNGPGRERQEERPSIHAARDYKRARPLLGRAPTSDLEFGPW